MDFGEDRDIGHYLFNLCGKYECHQKLRSLKFRLREERDRRNRLLTILNENVTRSKKKEFVQRPAANCKVLSMLTNYSILYCQDCIKLNFLPYHSGKRNGVFTLEMTKDKSQVLNHNLPAFIDVDSLCKKSSSINAFASLITYYLRAFDSRSLQVQEMTDKYNEQGISSVMTNASCTKVVFDLVIRSDSEADFTVTISMKYNLDGIRPLAGSISVKPHLKDFHDEDLQVLMEQCQELYKCDLHEAVERAFLD